MYTTNFYGSLDRGMFILQLYRWKFSHKTNFAVDCIRLKLNFIHKKNSRQLTIADRCALIFKVTNLSNRKPIYTTSY